MMLIIEKSWPYLFALVALISWHYFSISLPSDEPILSSSLTIGSILTGFLATSKAILMTLDSPIMQRIRNTSYINDLASYLGEAIWVNFGFTIICIVGYFLSTSNYIYASAWIFLGAAGAATFIRVTSIMLKILKYRPS